MRFHFGSLYYLLKILTNKKMLKFILTIILFILILLFVKNYNVSAAEPTVVTNQQQDGTVVVSGDSAYLSIVSKARSFQDSAISSLWYYSDLNSTNFTKVKDFCNSLFSNIFIGVNSQSAKRFLYVLPNFDNGLLKYSFYTIPYSVFQSLDVSNMNWSFYDIVYHVPINNYQYVYKYQFYGVDGSATDISFVLPSTELNYNGVCPYVADGFSSRWFDLFSHLGITDFSPYQQRVLNELSNIENHLIDIRNSLSNTINQQGQATQSAINQQGQATQSAINQQGQATQSAINNQSQQQQQRYEESFDNSYQNVDIDLPSDNGLNDVTADGINNIFQRVQNAFLSDQYAEIVWHIPFFNVDYKISTSWVKDIYQRYFGVMYQWVQSFWAYFLSVIVIRDMSLFFDRLKSGVFDKDDVNIKTVML